MSSEQWALILPWGYKKLPFPLIFTCRRSPVQLLITQPQAQRYGRGRAEQRNGTGGEKKEHKTVKVIFKNYFILYLSIITHIHTYTVFVLVSRRVCTMYRIQGVSHQLSHSFLLGKLQLRAGRTSEGWVPWCHLLPSALSHRSPFSCGPNLWRRRCAVRHKDTLQGSEFLHQVLKLQRQNV